MAQEYAKRKLVTKLRKKDAPSVPQRADMPEYEDTTEYEQYQARDEEDVNEIDPETNLPYEDIPGVEESVGPDDLLGPGELKAGAALLKGVAAKGAPMMMLGSMAKTGAPKFSKVAQAEIARIEANAGRKLSEKEAQIAAQLTDKKVASTPAKDFAANVAESAKSAPVSDRELQQEVIRNPELMKLRGLDKEAARAKVQEAKDLAEKNSQALRSGKELGSRPAATEKTWQEQMNTKPIGVKAKPVDEKERVYRMNSFQTDQRPGFHESESQNAFDYSDINKSGSVIKKLKKPVE